MLQFPIYDLFEDIRGRFFPQLHESVGIGFLEQESLAYIRSEPKPSFINVHVLLNGPYTPVEVMSLFIKHELLHLFIPARDIDGKKVSHPPEFFEEEGRIAPERDLAWSWIWWNFHDCLKRCKEEERTIVRKGWKMRLRLLWQNHPEIDLSMPRKFLLGDGRELPPEGEFLKWL